MKPLRIQRKGITTEVTEKTEVLEAHLGTAPGSSVSSVVSSLSLFRVLRIFVVNKNLEGGK